MFVIFFQAFGASITISITLCSRKYFNESITGTNYQVDTEFRFDIGSMNVITASRKFTYGDLITVDFSEGLIDSVNES